MPEPDWEPRIGVAAASIVETLNSEFTERSLLPMIGESSYILTLALAQAIRTGIRIGIRYAAGEVEPEESISPELRRCQNCTALPVVIRWYTPGGPIDLCSACDRRRIQGKKITFNFKPE